MAPVTSLVTRGDDPQHQLDSAQTLRASSALLRKIQSDQDVRKDSPEKNNLLADADNDEPEDQIPIWLVLTTKKHIVDKKRLKPGKIVLPHPFLDAADPNLRICLITANPQRKYKDLIAAPEFPLDLAKCVKRVIDITKLKAKYGKSFEARRQLYSEYDVFLADDRIIIHLAQTLGKVFYKNGSKRPIPVTLEGRRQDRDEQGNKRRKLSEGGTKVIKAEVKPQAVAKEIQRALSSALVHLAPSTTTAIKVGLASFPASSVQANIEAVVEGMVEKYVPQKWSNLQSVHIKGPNTIALPIWLASQLWQDDADVLEERPSPLIKEGRKRKRQEETKVIEVPGPDGQMRRLEKPVSAKKEKIVDGEPHVESVIAKTRKSESIEEAKVKATEKAEKAARKEALKVQKEQLKSGTKRKAKS